MPNGYAIVSNRFRFGDDSRNPTKPFGNMSLSNALTFKLGTLMIVRDVGHKRGRRDTTLK